MRKAIVADPASPRPLFGLATLLQAQGRLDEAVANYERVLVLAPDDSDCMIDLAGCKLAQGKAVDAETILRRAIALQPERAVGWVNLGAALGRQDREEEAREAFERAMRIEATTGQNADAFVNLAINACDDGRVAEALELYAKNLPERPCAHGSFGYSIALLTAGRLDEAWEIHEFRWVSEPLLSRRLNQPVPAWSGQDLRGKTLLLRAEQGIGDTIQFVRYAPQLKALGAEVWLFVFGGLDRLARRFPGVDRVFGRDDRVPEFDFYCNLLSLPRVFGTSLATVPVCDAYLSPNPREMAKWEPRVAAHSAFKVGLAWGGSPIHARDRYRSIPPKMLAPLADVAGVMFFSLQKGGRAAPNR